MYRNIVRRFFVLGALLAFGVSMALAQDASVKVRVSPPEAYIFVDGQPFAHRSQTIFLSSGEHTIGVYNYGFVPHITAMNLMPGKNPEIIARLEPVSGGVNGPWGKVQIEHAPNDKAAVYVNGIKPEYFVGHVDEFNNGFLAHQKLVLPVGTYQLIIVNPKESEPIYNEQIEVRNNERVIVNVADKTAKYEKWHGAGKREELARFKSGGPTTTVAVAPVEGNFAIDKVDVKCQEPVTLSWNTKEAVDTTIAASPAVEVQPNGQRVDNPTQTTTYTFQTKGPGGIVTQRQTVHVDPNVQTALTASPTELRYRRIDDKVIVPANTTLAWNTDNAQKANLEPLGNVAMNGEQQIAAQPTKSEVGAVDEVVVYSLAANNNCGGSDKALAAVHITGTIEPLPVVPLASLFFPTNYPTTNAPELGLLKSEQEKLVAAVLGFNKFLEYDPDTKIKIFANTDPRSPDDYNMALSDRRGEIVKAHLVALGVDPSRIEVVAQGETQQLDRATVEAIEANNPDRHGRVTTTLVLAYNRRVDLVMIPTQKPEQKSVQNFPHTRLLESTAQPGLRTMQKNSAPAAGSSAAGEQ
jgi:hypothetical protein